MAHAYLLTRKRRDDGDDRDLCCRARTELSGFDLVTEDEPELARSIDQRNICSEFGWTAGLFRLVGFAASPEVGEPTTEASTRTTSLAWP